MQTTYYLYKDGDQFVDRTGGWQTGNIYETSSARYQSVTFYDDYVRFSDKKETSLSSAMNTGEKIDISKFTKLKIKIKNHTYINNGWYVMFSDNSSNVGSALRSGWLGEFLDYTFTDAMKAKGSGYIIIFYDTTNGGMADVSEIWLE